MTSVASVYDRAVEVFHGVPLPTQQSLRRQENSRAGLDVDGCHVELILYYNDRSDRTRVSQTTWLGIEASASGSHDLSLGLGRGFLHLMLGLFRDIEIGDPAFDDRHVIRTNDLDMARLWLGEAVRRAYDASPGYPTQLEHGRVTVRVGGETRFARLQAGLEATAALAGRGYAIADELRAIAPALDATAPDTYWSPGEFALTMDRGAHRIALDYVCTLPDEPARARGLRTRLHTHRLHDTAPPLLLYHRDMDRRRRPSLPDAARCAHDLGEQWLVEAAAPVPAAELLAGVRRLVHAARPALISLAGSDATVFLPGAPVDVPRLRAAVDLIHQLAHAMPDAGPYR